MSDIKARIRMDSLKETLPELDTDTLEYIKSIATDSAMSKNEKAEMITEHLSCYTTDVGGLEKLINTFIEVQMHKALDEEQTRRLEKAKDVGAYIDVLRSSTCPAAPVVCESPEDDLEAQKIKKNLLRQYDPDDVPRAPVGGEVKKKGAKTKEESKTNSEDEELIHGLGANENKLFKLREREEMRARSKAEQEEARAFKVQQKLKQQGNEIKATNRRK